MNVTPETVAAVNEWQRNYIVSELNLSTGRVETHDLDTDDVRALLLALAKCEPVRGLVVELRQQEAHHEGRADTCKYDGKRLSAKMHDWYASRIAAALAPFAEVE